MVKHTLIENGVINCQLLWRTWLAFYLKHCCWHSGFSTSNQLLFTSTLSKTLKEKHHPPSSKDPHLLFLKIYIPVLLYTRAWNLDKHNNLCPLHMAKYIPGANTVHGLDLTIKHFLCSTSARKGLNQIQIWGMWKVTAVLSYKSYKKR